MSLTAWIIFISTMLGLIFFNLIFFRNKKSGGNQKDTIPGVAVKKEPWQKRSLFNGFIYYVLPPLLWAIGTIAVVNAIA